MTRKTPWLFVFALFFMLTDVQTASAGCLRSFVQCSRAAWSQRYWLDRGIDQGDCEIELAACLWELFRI